MPVLLPFSVFFGSLGTLIVLITRRFRIIRKTYELQEELEASQKQIDRAEKKEKFEKEKALKEIRIAQEQKHQALRNIGLMSELMKKAELELERNQDEEAMKTLIQVLALDENHRKANELLAKLYLRSTQEKKAELIYRKLIDLYPFDPEFYASLGHSYFQRHQFKAATKAYEKALSIDKNNPQRYLHLGNVYATKKEFKIALEHYVKAHRLDVRNIELMFLIIEVCLQNSDPISAREYLHKILDYEPYNQQAKTLLGEVLRMLNTEQ